jgi:uncharacterized membrane protein YphA (DoxX/SURF4 family)
MRDIAHTNHWIKVHGDLFIDLVRIYLGAALFFKGLYFATHIDALLSLMEHSGKLWLASGMISHFVILVHLVGGFFLMIGLVTRAAALVQIPILLVASAYVYLPKVMGGMEMRQSFELAALTLFLLILIAIYGAGRWSVDFTLHRKENEKLFRPDDDELTKPA